MALTRDQIDTLVAELEKKYRGNPNSYKRNVILLGLLGYIYLALVLLIPTIIIVSIILALINGSIISAFIKGLFLGIFIFIALRPLGVKLLPPWGIILKQEEAPRLFEEIKNLSKKLHTPNIDAVILFDEFKTGALQTPLWGLLPNKKSYLVVGMPLMQALSPDQFRSVLAHEFSHLSNANIYNWIYYIRTIWLQFSYRLETRKDWHPFLFKKFFSWYAPYFHAYSFISAHVSEYEADKLAAQICGAEITADALISLQIRNRYLQKKYWPDLYKKNQSEAMPVFFPIRDLTISFKKELTIDQNQTWLDAALKFKTDTYDTHPSLADRLAALRKPPQLPPDLKETAAEHFFGRNMNQLINRLDKAWQLRTENLWKQHYEYAKDLKQKLGILNKKSLSETLTVQERIDHAVWTETLNGVDPALSLYRDILEQDASNVSANFAVGRILLSQDNEQGIQHIEKAMQLDTKTIVPGCDCLYDFMYRQGRLPDAKKYEAEAVKQLKLEENAKHERDYFKTTDNFIAADLPKEELDQLSNQLRNYSALESVYLVRKRVEHLTEQKLYVLGIKTRVGHRSDKQMRALVNQILQEITLPKETSILRLNNFNDVFLKKMQKISESKIL